MILCNDIWLNNITKYFSLIPGQILRYSQWQIDKKTNSTYCYFNLTVKIYLGILKKQCAKMQCHYNLQYTNIFFLVPCAFEININLHVYGKIHLCWLWPYHIVVYGMRHALLPYLLYCNLTCRFACSVECYVILMSYFRRSHGLIRQLFTRLNIKAARSVAPKPTKAIHPRANCRSSLINDVNTFYRVYSNGWPNFIMPYDNISL